MLSYRLLPHAEWDQVKPFFDERGVSLPQPSMAQICVAEDEGKIVGFLVRQLMWHVEPLSIAPDYRGKANWLRMSKLLEDGQTIYVFSDSPERDRMCELGKMTKLPYTVYSKAESK